MISHGGTGLTEAKSFNRCAPRLGERKRSKSALPLFLRASVRKSKTAHHTSNLIPCASGRSFDQLIVQVWRRMYCFQLSEPDSRPPPVSFSPPNAPPISAPEVPMFTFAMPQSEPSVERNR